MKKITKTTSIMLKKVKGCFLAERLIRYPGVIHNGFFVLTGAVISMDAFKKLIL